jgi:hypothetical protein
VIDSDAYRRISCIFNYVINTLDLGLRIDKLVMVPKDCRKDRYPYIRIQITKNPASWDPADKTGGNLDLEKFVPSKLGPFVQNSLHKKMQEDYAEYGYKGYDITTCSIKSRWQQLATIFNFKLSR